MSAAGQRPVLLCLRALGLGDLLTAVPALRGLRRGFPDHDLVVAAPGWLAPIVGLVEAVDRHLVVGELQPLPPDAHGPDVAVNLHGSGPQSHRLLLAAQPGRLVAFRHPDVPASGQGPDWRADEHEVARWCRLARHVGAPADPDDLDLVADEDDTVAAFAGATVIHPGAKAVARRWPAERFAAVAASEAAAGRTVVVTGGPDERDLAEEVAAAAGLPSTAALAGRLHLGQLASLVAVAGRVVCGDTGVAHLATALATPSVVLFGPMPPALWGPPPARRDRHRVLWAGRRGDPLGEAPDPGLAAVGVDEVLAALRELGPGSKADPRRNPGMTSTL